MARFTAQTRGRWPCPCGCGLELPTVTGTLGANPTHVVLGHHEGKPAVFIVAHTVLPQRTGVLGFRVVAGTDDFQWRPLFPDEIPALRPEGPLLDPADWDGADQQGAAQVKRLDAVFPAEAVALWHLNGAQSRDLDFSFQVPDPLLSKDEGTRRANKNFATLGPRTFLRALLPLPVVGGEFRVGVWCEVPAADFERVYDSWDGADYASARARGQVANRFRIDDVPLLGETVDLAPRTENECLFVSALPAAISVRARQPLTPEELKALIAGLEASVRREH